QALLSLTRDTHAQKTSEILSFRQLPYFGMRAAFILSCLQNSGDLVMYLERLKSVRSTERGLHLTFSSSDTEASIELSPEAVEQTFKTLHGVTPDAGEGPLTFTALGHQVVRTHEAYGLLLRTREFGDVVFSLPPAILKRLIGDLMRLASSPPTSQTFPGTRPPTHAAT